MNDVIHFCIIIVFLIKSAFSPLSDTFSPVISLETMSSALSRFLFSMCFLSYQFNICHHTVIRQYNLPAKPFSYCKCKAFRIFKAFPKYASRNVSSPASPPSWYSSFWHRLTKKEKKSAFLRICSPYALFIASELTKCYNVRFFKHIMRFFIRNM